MMGLNVKPKELHLTEHLPQNTRNNSFGFIRFLAATGVILSHHFAISGFDEPNIEKITFGSVSVYCFFLISGFLILKSIQRNGSFLRFCSARLLRIIPNLLFVLLVTSAATLVVYSNYGHISDHMLYVVQNIVMLLRGGPRYEVIGIWQDRPFHSLNGSIWSLPYEVWCYFFLYAIVIHFERSNRIILIAAVLICALMTWSPDIRFWPFAIFTGHLGELGFWFFLGAVFAAFSINIPIASSATMSWFERLGDPSYGMYISAWPIQQACAILIPNFWLSLVVSFILIVTLGYSTWHLFEKRALGQVEPLERWLKKNVLRFAIIGRS